MPEQPEPKQTERPPYIDPLNHYTGGISGVAIMQNIKNGYTTFPEGMGNTQAAPSPTLGR